VALRKVLGEARQLLGDRHQAPAADGIWRWKIRRVAANDRRKQADFVDVLRETRRIEAGRNCSPGMCDQRNAFPLRRRDNMIDNPFDLVCRIRCTTDGRPVRVTVHLARTLGATEACKVESPRIKTCRAEIVHPRAPCETVGNGKRRWKRRAMHIKDRRAGTSLPPDKQRRFSRDATQQRDAACGFGCHSRFRLRVGLLRA